VAVRGADAVISISRHSEAMARAAGTPPERLHRIAPAVDHPPPSRDPARHPDPRPTVLTIARMAERYKGHDVMVRAVPLLVGRVPDARWVVVGDGPLRPSLEERAAAIGARDSVLFTGAISDEQRESWLWRARVFAMPSRLPPGGLGGEGFGIAYLEAAARGLPVVAGDEGGAVDAVDPGRSAYMVDPRDHVSVAEAIAGLLECQQAAHALGEAGRRWASKFTWPATAARVAEVLRSVAARGAGS
jgi:phosphatidylinositol alpha-1,6-mannosyltransferase